MKWKTNKLKILSKALLKINDNKKMMSFLRDVCTLEELDVISSRFETVLLIDQGLSYRDIAKKTGLSTTTVTRIAYWLNNGEGGYKHVIDKMNKKK